MKNTNRNFDLLEGATVIVNFDGEKYTGKILAGIHNTTSAKNQIFVDFTVEGLGRHFQPFSRKTGKFFGRTCDDRLKAAFLTLVQTGTAFDAVPAVETPVAKPAVVIEEGQRVAIYTGQGVYSNATIREVRKAKPGSDDRRTQVCLLIDGREVAVWAYASDCRSTISEAAEPNDPAIINAAKPADVLIFTAVVKWQGGFSTRHFATANECQTWIDSTFAKLSRQGKTHISGELQSALFEASEENVANALNHGGALADFYSSKVLRQIKPANCDQCGDAIPAGVRFCESLKH